MVNIAIWGAGCFGNYVAEMLKNNNTVKVVCFIDNNAAAITGKDVEVVAPNVFLEKYDEIIEFVLVAFLDGFVIREQLQAMKIRTWGVINNRVYYERLYLKENLKDDYNILWNDDKAFELPAMETLESNVVDYCNLNCKGCSHFSNIFEKGAQIPFEIFKRDIKYLADKIYIKYFNLLGGEALLSERILDYIICLRKYMPKTHIVIVTNGILIPTLRHDILQGIADYGVKVSITRYIPVVKLEDKIKSTLEQYNISYEFRESVDTFGKNIDLAGGNDPLEAQKLCRESTCQFLRDGKIYKCPFSALGNYFFDHYGIPLHFQEGIDIFDERVNWHEIGQQLREQPIKLCKYCGPEEQFDWEISVYPQREDWLIKE